MKFLRRGLIIFFSVIVVCGLIIWAFSPLISRPILGSALEQQGLILDEKSSVRLNPFTSHLTIHEFAWQAQNNTVFQLDKLSVKYSLTQLVFSTVYISEIKVEGIQAKLAQKGNLLTVLGVPLSDADDQTQPAEPSDPAASSSEQASEQTEPSNIIVELVSATFTDIQLDADIDGQTQTLVINEFALDNIGFDGTAFSGTSHINIALNPNPVDNTQTQVDPDIVIDLDVATIPDISLQAELRLAFAGDLASDISVELNDINLVITELAYRDDNYQAQLDQFDLSIPHFSALMGEQQTVNAQINVATKGVQVSHINGTELVNIQTIAIPNIQLALANNLLTSSLELLEITNGMFLASTNNITESTLPMTSFNALTLNTLSTEVNLNNNNTHIGLSSILLDELKANVEVDENGDIEALAFLSTDEDIKDNVEDETSAEDSPAPTSAPSDTKLTFHLGTFALSSPASLKAVDSSVNPKFAKSILIDTLRIENINNTHNDEEVSFVLSLKDDEYFTYNISGKAQPFLDKLNLTLTSDIQQLAVNEFSPYLYDTLGFGVDAGQLDSDITIEVIEDTLDGKVKINLRGASFSSNKAKQDDELDMVGQAAIPLNVALNMLKDSDGNIILTIPVDGDINDPSFGVQYILGLVVKKAVMNQTKKHLINTFVPYGQILSVAYSAGSYALKVRFEDLVYPEQQAELNDSQSEFVEQFTALLSKKESLQVRLCPIATTAELDTPIVDNKLSAEQKQQLIDLATARAAIFKRTVTEKGGDSARLLVCSPEIDFSEKALPRINFTT